MLYHTSGYAGSSASPVGGRKSRPQPIIGQFLGLPKRAKPSSGLRVYDADIVGATPNPKASTQNAMSCGNLTNYRSSFSVAYHVPQDEDTTSCVSTGIILVVYNAAILGASDQLQNTMQC